MTEAPVLVVEHETQCPPGWVGEWLLSAGARLDLRRPYAGDALPADLRGHSGMVVLGGSMGADDDVRYPWLTEVKALVRVAAEDAVPTLGICLGHQLCAAAFGGEVARNPRGQQVGVLEVGWTADATGDGLLGPLAVPGVRAVQWNNDIVTAVPPGGVLLARTPYDEVQAARFASTVWGVQWHPEVGADIVRSWAENDRDEARERGVDLERYVRDVADAREEMRATWAPLVDGFMALTRASLAER